MALDQNTLFVAAGICSLAVALTLLSVWYQNRVEKFLLWGSLGMILLGAGAVLYYSGCLDLASSSILAFGLETVGFMLLLVGARQVAGSPSGFPLCGAASIFIILSISVPIVLGFIGVGTIVFNLASAALLLVTARKYASIYREAHVSVVALVILYSLTAVSFFFCGAVLAYRQQWILTEVPNNRAEDFNAVIAIIGITCIGALSLSLIQSRVSRRHALDARTDSLTGLLNRRALVECLPPEKMQPGDSVVIFDLDAFKSINDSYGHSIGDAVLLEFAAILRANADEDTLIARIGGEEFVMIFRQTANVNVLTKAENVRKTLLAHTFRTPRDIFNTTTSAGIAFLTPSDDGFESVLHRADAALYRAKELGRNRICTELQIVA